LNPRTPESISETLNPNPKPLPLTDCFRQDVRARTQRPEVARR